MIRVGDALPSRIVKHQLTNLPLVSVGGHYGCYVRIEPTEDFMGEKAREIMMLLTPGEARELSYHLRATADVVDQGRHELGLYR